MTLDLAAVRAKAVTMWRHKNGGALWPERAEGFYDVPYVVMPAADFDALLAELEAARKGREV